jgi:hypothetical protein
MTEIVRKNPKNIMKSKEYNNYKQLKQAIAVNLILMRPIISRISNIRKILKRKDITLIKFLFKGKMEVRTTTFYLKNNRR